MPTIANVAIGVIGGVTIWIILIVIACVIIDRGNYVNLDGGE